MPNKYRVELLMSEFVTHDVKRFIVSRPSEFHFKPGQGVELAIDSAQWQGGGRPFTPTCLVDDEVLEFTIKRYDDHAGLTQALHRLPSGSPLLMTDPFGTISFQGPGVFIAGGAGITPFLAILREQAHDKDVALNTLIFSNTTPADIICEKELRNYLGERCILTCTRQAGADYEHRRINKVYLEEKIANFNQHFYVCGPSGFMHAVTTALSELGADPQTLVFEK